MNKILPNFLIIGAQKAGTTSLYHYLKQHPEIFLADVKEPRFFAFKDDDLDYKGPNDPSSICKHKNIDNYLALFENTVTYKIRGEASTIYHYSKEAPKNISRIVPHAKLVMILRHPVQRAYSNYLYTLRDGRESEENFEDALNKEEDRIKNHWGPLWHYKRRGLYGEQMERYLDYIDRSQIRFYLFEDLKENIESVYADICKFLDVDHNFEPDFNINYNPSGVPRSKRIQKVLANSHPLKKLFSFVPRSVKKKLNQKLMKLNLSRDPDDLPLLRDETYNQLLRYYRNDILKLQDIIEQDLSHWLEVR